MLVEGVQTAVELCHLVVWSPVGVPTGCFPFRILKYHIRFVQIHELAC